MNQIALIKRSGNPQFDVLVDGQRLQEHFVGRRGEHPFALWKGHADTEEEIARLLVQRNPTLNSGRVPTTFKVCRETCGRAED